MGGCGDVEFTNGRKHLAGTAVFAGAPLTYTTHANTHSNVA